MTDLPIVEKLRASGEVCRMAGPAWLGDEMLDAADAIETLFAALERAAHEMFKPGVDHGTYSSALAALEKVRAME